MKYELVCILSPKIIDKEIDGEVDKIDKILSENSVENLEKNVWGKKELAYPIDKFFDGYYVQYNFELSPETVGKIDKKLKLEEKIIRFLIIKQDKIPEVIESEEEDKKEIRKKEKTEEKVERVEIDKIEKKEEKKEAKKDEGKKDFEKQLDEVLGKDITD